MKKILMVIVMVMCASNCFAGCEDLAKMSKFMMELRQNGVMIYDQYAIIDEIETSPEIKKLFKKILNDVYTIPIYNDPSDKQLAAIEFSNNIYLNCSKVIENE